MESPIHYKKSDRKRSLFSCFLCDAERGTGCGVRNRPGVGAERRPQIRRPPVQGGRRVGSLSLLGWWVIFRVSP